MKEEKKNNFQLDVTRIHPVYASVVPIVTMASNAVDRQSDLDHGTGTFFSHNGKTYLITCRHVLVNEDEHYYPDSLRIIVHTGTGPIFHRTVNVPLYGREDGSVKPLWIDHPKYHDKVDIAAVDITGHLRKGDILKAWTENEFLSTDLDVPIAARLAVIGYPLEFYDAANNLPVVRSAGLASAFGVPFNKELCFLIDANLHPGTSGSPVVTGVPRMLVNQKWSVVIDNKPPALLGVNSGEFPDRGMRTMLGLHRVWYSWLIEEVVRQ